MHLWRIVKALLLRAHDERKEGKGERGVGCGDRHETRRVMMVSTTLALWGAGVLQMEAQS